MHARFISPQLYTIMDNYPGFAKWHECYVQHITEGLVNTSELIDQKTFTIGTIVFVIDSHMKLLIIRMEIYRKSKRRIKTESMRKLLEKIIVKW